MLQKRNFANAGKNSDGTTEIVYNDRNIRLDATSEKIQALSTALMEGGVITVGNSSPLNAGASCIMLASE